MIQKFEFKETEIKGLIEVTPFNADDIRGCFTKDYSKEVFEANGIKHDLAEVFYTTSYKGVIRALHFQREKQQHLSLSVKSTTKYSFPQVALTVILYLRTA